MTEKLNTEVEIEAKALIFIGSMLNGKIILGEAGFEFKFKNPRLGKDLFYKWEDIVEAQVRLSTMQKLSHQFELVIRAQNNLRFSAKDSGKILKIIGQHIGAEHIVRAKSLTNMFLFK